MKNILTKYKTIIIFLLITIVATLYFSGIVTPYAVNHDFTGDGTIPEKRFVPIYVILTLPAYIVYVIYTCLVFKKLRPRFFMYPLICFTFYTGFIYSLMAFGGVIMWLLVFTILPLAILTVIAFIIGTVLDILELKRNKKNSDL